MPRRKNNLTKKKIYKLIKEGRGQGEKEHYIPWLQIGDFASLGRGNRVNTPNNKRVHHFHSDLERDYFFYMLWNDDVDDIREQFPLDPEEAVDIAKKLGYKPPKPYKSGCPYVMSTDMLVTIKENNKKYLEAYTIKYSHELKERRVFEKLAIEETYWGFRDIPYKIITENDFNRMVARNISMLFAHATIEPEISQDVVDHIYSELVKDIIFYKGSVKRLNDICINIDMKNGYEKGFTLRFFYYYAALKDIPVKLDQLIVGTCNIDKILDYECFERMLKGEGVSGDIV
jgi:hypothetical protein